ncbi:hypothetical protein CTAYLR_001260 [Chrysophaeum taylorii]|uniref:DUF1989 domain-containing protein n=1 Tax=Chrysophaeum taylorii TaxID=2483200 RepID=A0AAD7UCU7_9STRA|nr:hypothetical protein CTAYLR_001260 [Chrysophaeum taylorii]
MTAVATRRVLSHHLARRRSLVVPVDAEARRQVVPVTCYEVDKLPPVDVAFYERARSMMRKIDQVVVPPREGRCFQVPAGHLFRIVCAEGPQVGDLNLWCSDDLGERSEKFYASKTRQLQATHLSTGDRLWSGFPYLRPIATITHDTLAWYRGDDFGGGVHDVIGSRCDPYTNAVIRGEDYHHCCHSNLSVALSTSRTFASIVATDDPVQAARLAEPYVHDVLNVFMCTGFDRNTRKYFMKSTPARRADFLEFFAEIPLLGALSACPGGDCGASHSDDATQCYPLLVEVFETSALNEWRGPPPVLTSVALLAIFNIIPKLRGVFQVSAYSRTHGLRPGRLPPH